MQQFGPDNNSHPLVNGLVRSLGLDCDRHSEVIVLAQNKIEQMGWRVGYQGIALEESPMRKD